MCSVLFKYLFGCAGSELRHLGSLVVARSIFSYSMQTLSCSMWDLVPWPGIKPRPPVLGVWTLSHWTTREVPVTLYLDRKLQALGCCSPRRNNSGAHRNQFKSGIFWRWVPWGIINFYLINFFIEFIFKNDKLIKILFIQENSIYLNNHSDENTDNCWQKVSLQWGGPSPPTSGSWYVRVSSPG